MIRVLCVDDDPLFLEVTRLFLEEEKTFQVDTETSARNALVILKTASYDAIVSDYHMPEMNGIEFLNAIRASGNDIPVVIFTGKGDEQIVIQALNAGADSYLQKGGDPQVQYTELSFRIRQVVQQRRAEIQIRDLEQRERDILNLLPDATLAIDKTGKVIVWNRAMEEMTGIPATRMLGKGDYEYALPFYGIRRPLLLDLIVDPVDSVDPLYTHIIRKDNTLISDIKITSPKGKTLTLMGKAGPLFDRQGEIVGAMESIRDITERTQAEEALRASEEKYRALAENMADVIFSLDVNGIVTYISPHINKYGFLIDEIVSRNFADLVYTNDRRRVRENFQKTILSGREQNSIFRIADKWGYIHWVEERSTIQMDIYGRVISLNGVLQDITDRRRAEEAILLANKKLNLLNNITRHDILNTITGLLGLVDMAAATGDKEERAVLYSQIKERVSMIQRQIAFTREYQEVGVNAPRWQNFDELIERILPGFSLSKIAFVFDLRDLEIYADPLLEKVFYNLIDNAIRYGETLSTVSFYCQISDAGLALICEDDGVGIPATAKEQIFERGIGKNTGMGLFLTREILLITGITIRETGTYHHGARFELLIPNGAWRFAKTGTGS